MMPLVEHFGEGKIIRTEEDNGYYRWRDEKAIDYHGEHGGSWGSNGTASYLYFDSNSMILYTPEGVRSSISDLKTTMFKRRLWGQDPTSLIALCLCFPFRLCQLGVPETRRQEEAGPGHSSLWFLILSASLTGLPYSLSSLVAVSLLTSSLCGPAISFSLQILISSPLLFVRPTLRTVCASHSF